MKRILKSIGRALKVALRMSLNALRYGTAAAMVPLAAGRDILAGFFGGGYADDLPEPEVADDEQLDLDQSKDPNAQRDVMSSRLRTRIRPHAPAFEYCCMPKERRRHCDLSGLPLSVASWCRKLTEVERQRVKEAGLLSMCNHLEGKKLIDGVSRPPVPVKSFVDDLDRDFEPTPAFYRELAIAKARVDHDPAPDGYRLH